MDHQEHETGPKHIKVNHDVGRHPRSVTLPHARLHGAILRRLCSAATLGSFLDCAWKPWTCSVMASSCMHDWGLAVQEKLPGSWQRAHLGRLLQHAREVHAVELGVVDVEQPVHFPEVARRLRARHSNLRCTASLQPAAVCPLLPHNSWRRVSQERFSVHAHLASTTTLQTCRVSMPQHLGKPNCSTAYLPFSLFADLQRRPKSCQDYVQKGAGRIRLPNSMAKKARCI